MKRNLARLTRITLPRSKGSCIQPFRNQTDRLLKHAFTESIGKACHSVDALGCVHQSTPLATNRDLARAPRHRPVSVANANHRPAARPSRDKGASSHHHFQFRITNARSPLPNSKSIRLPSRLPSVRPSGPSLFQSLTTDNRQPQALSSHLQRPWVCRSTVLPSGRSISGEKEPRGWPRAPSRGVPGRVDGQFRRVVVAGRAPGGQRWLH